MENALQVLNHVLSEYPYKEVKDYLPLLTTDMTVESKIMILNFLIRKNPQVKAYVMLFNTMEKVV